VWPGNLNNLEDNIGEVNKLTGPMAGDQCSRASSVQQLSHRSKGLYVFLARRSDDFPLLEQIGELARIAINKAVTTPS